MKSIAYIPTCFFCIVGADEAKYDVLRRHQYEDFSPILRFLRNAGIIVNYRIADQPLSTNNLYIIYTIFLYEK